MPKTREQKQKTVEELKKTLAKSSSIVFADIQGLKAKELTVLRRKMKEAGGIFKVAKKTLLALVFREKKSELPLNPRQMSGEIAVVFGPGDAILPLKTLYNFSREHEKPKLIAGILENSVFDQTQLLAIAQLPSREELRTRFLASLTSPLSGLLNILEGNIKGLIFVLSSIKK